MITAKQLNENEGEEVLGLRKMWEQLAEKSVFPSRQNKTKDLYRYVRLKWDPAIILFLLLLTLLATHHTQPYRYSYTAVDQQLLCSAPFDCPSVWHLSHFQTLILECIVLCV
jgi:hypothetical protein